MYVGSGRRTVESSSDSCAAGTTGWGGLAEDSAAPTPAENAAARRSAYLEYLRSCLRQQRAPAPEVVEVARAHGDLYADASLLALQIRAAEEQLGMLVQGGGSNALVASCSTVAATA